LQCVQHHLPQCHRQLQQFKPRPQPAAEAGHPETVIAMGQCDFHLRSTARPSQGPPSRESEYNVLETRRTPRHWHRLGATWLGTATPNTGLWSTCRASTVTYSGLNAVERPALDPFPTIMIDGKVRVPLLHFLYDAARRQRCGTVTRFRSAWRSRTARGIACTAALTAQTCTCH
jgi:hypothetical protein